MPRHTGYQTTKKKNSWDRKNGGKKANCITEKKCIQRVTDACFNIQMIRKCFQYKKYYARDQ